MRRLCFIVIFLPLVAIGFDPAEQDDSQALVRYFKSGPDPVESLTQQSSFSPRTGDIIYLIGGTDVFTMQESGTFETALHLLYPDRNLKVRNLGWPADTVYRQQRPMYFFTETGDTQVGSLPDQRAKFEPGICLLRFGKMESLDGAEEVDAFKQSYESLILALEKAGNQVVLIYPERFSKNGPAANLSASRNDVLAAYRNGIDQLAHELNLEAVVDFEMLVRPADEKNLRALVLAKNRLWDQYYRPTNWAFLFGDRQHVPSSRNDDDTEKRWFVEEIQKLPRLIEKADEKIWKSAR